MRQNDSPENRLATHIEEPSTSSADNGRPHVRYLAPPGMELDDDHRLRIVRTPTESLHEVAREDERRRVGKRKRKGTFKKWGTSRLGRAMSVSTVGKDSISEGTTKRPGTASSAQGTNAIAGAGLAVGGFGEFGSQLAPTNTRTADEEQEAKAEQFRTPTEEGVTSDKKDDGKAAESRRRRNVYVNIDLPMSELDKHGQPRIYARNKVRTSKYTIWTFLPKNLGEQFRRVANLYFLGLVILQSKPAVCRIEFPAAIADHVPVFPIFGGASPVLAMLPLLAIITITGIKDGIEDYRRQELDEAVNNSAVTRLGDWKNVNIPSYHRGFFARLFGLSGGSAAVNRSAKVSKGVRKLRQKEGSFSTDFLYAGGAQQSSLDLEHAPSNASAPFAGHHINALSQVDSNVETLEGKSEDGHAAQAPAMNRFRSGSMSRSMATTARTLPQKGVVDYTRASAGTGKWERTLWKKLEVGDVVLLRENDQVPADMVVLSSSDADGQCFVETKNLDGETNLKPRRSLKATMGIQHEEDVEHAQFVVDSEPPHANLYSYNGVLRYWAKGDAPGREHPIVEHAQLGERQEKQEAITINELLLRGCAIRNTTWVIGLVVYTGADTKIMLNQGGHPFLSGFCS